jgi:hypothetical protein
MFHLHIMISYFLGCAVYNFYKTEILINQITVKWLSILKFSIWICRPDRKCWNNFIVYEHSLIVFEIFFCFNWQNLEYAFNLRKETRAGCPIKRQFFFDLLWLIATWEVIYELSNLQFIEGESKTDIQTIREKYGSYNQQLGTEGLLTAYNAY